jgi:hypothetical protein
MTAYPIFFYYIHGKKKMEDWRYSDMPKDGTVIMRWHKLYKCPIAVYYKERTELHLEWVERTMSNSWPEESFAPEAWMPIPAEPNIKLTYEERVRWFVGKYYETGMETSGMLEALKDKDLDNFEWYDETIKFPTYKSEM